MSMLRSILTSTLTSALLSTAVFGVSSLVISDEAYARSERKDRKDRNDRDQDRRKEKRRDREERQNLQNPIIPAWQIELDTRNDRRDERRDERRDREERTLEMNAWLANRVVEEELANWFQKNLPTNWQQFELPSARYRDPQVFVGNLQWHWPDSSKSLQRNRDDLRREEFIPAVTFYADVWVDLAESRRVEQRGGYGSPVASWRDTGYQPAFALPVMGVMWFEPQNDVLYMTVELSGVAFSSVLPDSSRLPTGFGAWPQERMAFRMTTPLPAITSRIGIPQQNRVPPLASSLADPEHLGALPLHLWTRMAAPGRENPLHPLPNVPVAPVVPIAPPIAPPIAQNPPPVDPSIRNVWVPMKAGQALPRGVAEAGFENNRHQPACRGPFQTGVHPGKVVDGRCNIGFGGTEIQLDTYEVLVGEVGRDFIWRSVLEAGFDSPMGGREADGTKLPVCRVFRPKADGSVSVQVGKVVVGNCNIGFGGLEEVFAAPFEVLFPMR